MPKRLARGPGIAPRQSKEVCSAFDIVEISFVDKDCIRRAVWATLPVAETLQSWSKTSTTVWWSFIDICLPIVDAYHLLPIPLVQHL